MGFISRIFSGGGQAAPSPPPIPPVAALPTPPTPTPAPAAAAPPPQPQLQSAATPGTKAQQAAVTATSILGAGATTGQKQPKTLLG